MSNYFENKSLAWKKMKIENNLTAAHRGLYWAIFERWNNHFFKEFEAPKHELMEMAGISSEKTYFLLLNDLIKFNYMDCQKGANRFKKSTITILPDHFKPAKTAGVKEDSTVEITEVIYASRVTITELDSNKVNATTVNFTELDADSTVDITELKDNTVNITELDSSAVDSTRVNITELEANRTVEFTGLKKSSAVNITELYIGKDILSSSTTLVNKTSIAGSNNNNIFLEEKNAREQNQELASSQKKPPRKRFLGVRFLDSEIGTLESLTDYIKNESGYPQADPLFYFNAVRDWRDKATGNEPLRQNWKLVINQFFRNDISRYGKVSSTNHGTSYRKQFDRDSPEFIQAEFADIDRNLEQFLAIRNRNGSN